MLNTLPFQLDYSQYKVIDQRLKEFSAFENKDNAQWFSELCFCLLTANAQAKRALLLQEAIGTDGFLTLPQDKLAAIIRSYGHRFHNTKSRYIVEARKYENIRELIMNLECHGAREFLVQNIKGLGYKEASHFLRNVGFHNVAIIDRHILKFMFHHKLIKEMPKTLTKRNYLFLEGLLRNYGIPLDKLDLLIWGYMTGQILK